MKKHFPILMLTLLALGLATARAQFGGPDGNPMDDAMAKVFGTNLNFSATMDTQMKMMPKGENIGMSGKIFFANGNSRTEMDMTEMKGGKMTPQALTQIKSMGMDKIVSISQTDKKVIYMIYPGLQAYAKIELPNAKSVQPGRPPVRQKQIHGQQHQNRPAPDHDHLERHRLEKMPGQNRAVNLDQF